MPNFNPQMLAQMREKMFSKLDGNGDGSIDQTELAATSSAKNGKGPDLATLLGGMDGDGDGGITSTEMRAGFQKVDARMQDQFLTMQEAGGPGGPGGRGGGGKPDADAVFSSLDANGDGVVDADELRNAKAEDTGETKRKPDLAALLGGFDGDGDGNLTKAELLSGFEQLDAKRTQGRVQQSMSYLLSLQEQQQAA